MKPDHQWREVAGPDRSGRVMATPHGGGFRGLEPTLVQGGTAASLQDQLNLSVIEVAVMWILHRGAMPRSRRSLARDVIEFHPVAQKALSRSEMLHDAKPSDLRLVYFKGLIVAQTHPRQQMIDAIRRAELMLNSAKAVNAPVDDATTESRSLVVAVDQDTLAHIADALGHPSSSSH